jgi:hypothetical protein
MAWPGLVRRFPVLAIRDFRLLLADRVLAPAAAAFSLVGVAFAVLRVLRLPFRGLRPIIGLLKDSRDHLIQGRILHAHIDDRVARSHHPVRRFRTPSEFW